MAPFRSKSEKVDNNNKQKVQKDNFVKLLAHRKLQGKFSQQLFRELQPALVRIPLQNIVTEGDRERHTFVGFTICGRYVLSYTKDWDTWTGYAVYHLYWWEFNLHSKLKQAQRVQLFADANCVITEDLRLTVCEWPKDDSKVVIIGSDARVYPTVLFISVMPKPPPAPCSHCCPMIGSATSSTIGVTDTGRGVCLEHGYVLCVDNEDWTLSFQAALHMKKDQVILWDTRESLIARGISFCPAGEHSQSPKIFGSIIALLSEEIESESSSSSPSYISTEDGSSSTPSPCSSFSSSPQEEASLSEPTYINYTHLHYCLPRPAEHADIPFEVDESLFRVTDLTGRELLPVRDSHNRPSVCVEQLTLHYDLLIDKMIRSGTWGHRIRDYDTHLQYDRVIDYDPVILEVCPETNQVVIDIGLLLLDSEEEEPNTHYQSNFQVSWDLNTGLCCAIGAGDLTEHKIDLFTEDWKSSHRKSCAEYHSLVVPGYVHCMSNEDLENGMLTDSDRCTSIVF